MPRQCSYILWHSNLSKPASCTFMRHFKGAMKCFLCEPCGWKSELVANIFLVFRLPHLRPSAVNLRQSLWFLLRKRMTQIYRKQVINWMFACNWNLLSKAKTFVGLCKYVRRFLSSLEVIAVWQCQLGILYELCYPISGLAGQRNLHSSVWDEPRWCSFALFPVVGPSLRTWELS